MDRIARYVQLPLSADRGPGALLEHYASLPPLPPYDTHPLDRVSIPMSRGSPGGKTLAFSFSGMTTYSERLVDRLVSGEKNVSIDHQSAGNRRVVGDIRSASLLGQEGDGKRVSGPRIIRQAAGVDEPLKREIARVFQEATMTHIAEKVGLCFRVHSTALRGARGLVMSGGVASNGQLRSKYVFALPLFLSTRL